MCVFSAGDDPSGISSERVHCLYRDANKFALVNMEHTYMYVWQCAVYCQCTL